EQRKACNIATRARQVRNEALTDWIVDHGKDDRDGAGHLFQRGKDRRCVGDDQVWCRVDEFVDISVDTIGIAASETVVDPNVAAFDPSERFKPLPKSRDAGLRLRVVLLCRPQQEPNPAHALTLLCACRGRIAEDAHTQPDDERAPPHLWMAPAM